ncbi:Leucine-rich repeat receptor-like protein kinase PXL2 [Dendrobium catenatum]|uniref:Leucine-rich repeat receptor-like protein kinase PXL2 n=2 Tax=Dendrobium catenatum TaxID=906689 RepID=A0A2I0VRQ7_9ASPA|nr:Leucine-rich repeat receptor-like protein kinase PXL2 [Dendrobium catenatum]
MKRKMGITTRKFFFLLFFFAFVSSYANLIVDEVSALLAVKSGLVDPLNALRDWKIATATAAGGHCSLTGVQCNAQGFVERLDLSHLNLSGVISFDNFRNLPALTHLNLCCNSFAGFLPEILPVLAELHELDISDNDFAGIFPVGFGSLPRLKTLNVSGNNFAGILPADVGNASLLETLDLRGCFFTGTIPESYKNLQKLKFLGLSGNNLTGALPSELGQLANLETLIIGYNGFVGNIPAEFGNLTNLRYFDMAVGSLSGPIPAELGKLSLLSIVYLYRNNLQGEIPKEIGNISSLLSLDLSDNLISGKIPQELVKLTNLQLLNLMCNKLEGSLPSGFGDLPQLQILELWNNSLTGPLPSNLGRKSLLQWLDVSSNSFSGEIPESVCYGGSLTKLILFNNNFSGPIPAGLSTCQSLVRVRIQNNRINGTVPAGLGQLPRLQRLEIADNEFSGEIPEDLSSSNSLSFIDFSGNRLQLSLPANILSIPTLQIFVASGNELAGQIPSDVEGCSALGTLDLSRNRLAGIIPASLTSCQRLINLNLSDNELTGEIPKAIALMPTLAILDLSHNSLTGSLPQNMGSSPSLETLNISYNKLSGKVPANGILRTMNPDDLAGNPDLCGGVLPTCSENYPVPESLMRPSSHIKHIVTWWLVSISAILATAGGFVLARRLYARWYIGTSCCPDRFDEDLTSGGGGAWPWRLTAFQRLNFTTADVLACIKDSNVVGMGATGIVYKAEIQRHHAVIAVKKLWRSAAVGRGDDAGEFVGEVNLLGRLRHRNIVRMLGYLYNDTETMLLYEYMPNGSLWEALHGEAVAEAGVLVDWVSRYNVAAGVAQGLAYLHHDCHPPVIHRDVKSSNILLDVNLDARIADFGLARTLLRKNETVSTIAGSYGYIAPEYGYTMKVDQKGDIYSFGVVLMELITGRKPIEAEFGEDQDIVGWVMDRLRTDRPPAVELLDRSIAGKCKHVQEEMLLLLRIALLCTARSPKDRPSMRNVLTMLTEAKPRRKSNSASGVTGLPFVAGKDVRPVFMATPPDSEYV